MFAFWCNEHRDKVAAFVEKFIEMFNKLAESNDVDAIPPTIQNDGVEEDNSAQAQ